MINNLSELSTNQYKSNGMDGRNQNEEIKNDWRRVNKEKQTGKSNGLIKALLIDLWDGVAGVKPESPFASRAFDRRRLKGRDMEHDDKLIQPYNTTVRLQFDT